MSVYFNMCQGKGWQFKTSSCNFCCCAMPCLLYYKIYCKYVVSSRLHYLSDLEFSLKWMCICLYLLPVLAQLLEHYTCSCYLLRVSAVFG